MSGARHYEQFSATTFTDSTMISGGRTTFGSGAPSLSALGGGGSCTGPITSTFLFTCPDHSAGVAPPSTYMGAEPPSALLRTNTVSPAVVFACTTQPVTVDFCACSFDDAGPCAGACCSCANTPTAPA